MSAAAPTERLLAAIPHRIVEAMPRRPLRAPGWSGEAMFVLDGILAIYRLDNARRQIVAVRFAGEAVLSFASGYGVEALVPSRVAIIGDTALIPPIHLLPLANRDARIAYEWLINIARDCTARVAHLLCETAVRGGYGTQHMMLPFTQEQIAEMTGQTSVNVNRVMQELAAMGLIERHNRAISFLDWDGLRMLAGFEPQYLEAA